MTTTAVGVMPLHNPDNKALPGAPMLKPDKKKKKELVKSNILRRLQQKQWK